MLAGRVQRREAVARCRVLVRARREQHLDHVRVPASAVRAGASVALMLPLPLCCTGSGVASCCEVVAARSFAGSAAAFKPHRQRDKGVHKTHTPNTAQELLSRQTKRHQWSEVLNQFFDAFNIAWESPDFYNATPEQLHSAFAAISDAQNKAAALAPHLQSIWREHHDLKQLHRLRINDCLKSIAYMVRDAEDFERLDLGAPRTAAIEAIAGEEL